MHYLQRLHLQLSITSFTLLAATSKLKSEKGKKTFNNREEIETIAFVALETVEYF